MTGTERLLATAVAAVLAAGTLSAAAVDPTPALQPAAAAPTSSPTAAPSPTAAVPAPAPKPAAPPAPKPKAAPQPAAAGPIPAPEEPPQAGCPVPRRPRTGPPPAPKAQRPPLVAEAALPAPLPPVAKADSLAAVSGKGFWVTNFAETPIDVPGLVATAEAGGLKSIWIRTGGKQGYYGDRFLPQLVPAAHAAGISVIAWDFPYLSDPVADAERARRAFADGVDAFAPDVETSAEGTYATARRVALYLSIVRRHAGARPVAATVPRPTPLRRKSFPYSAFVPYADLFVPMVYWSCREPGNLVIQSLHELGALLPVAPVGQGYDMGEEGGRRGHPTRAETWRFLDAARRGGAVGASLWTIERLGPGQFEALADYPWSPLE